MDNPNLDTTPKTENEPIKPASSDTNQEHLTAPWIIIVLIPVFQPLAWYVMYKEKRYHKWFAYLLLLHAILPFILLAVGIYIIPQLLNQSMSTSQSETISMIDLSVFIIIEIIEIGISILLLQKIKKGSKYKNLLYLILGVLFLNSIKYGTISIVAYVFLQAIFISTYKALSSIQLK